MTVPIEHAALDAALEAQRDGRWPEAEAHYREALASIDEPDAALLSNFGQVLRRQGHQEEAMAVYAKATAQADAPPAAWFNLGNAQLDQRRWQEAHASFEQALSGDPAMEPAALQLARCAVKLAQWPLARERFAAVLKGNPQNFSAWLEAGHVCRHHGTVAQALACYRRAAQVAPQRWLGHATLARALEDNGAWDEAAVHTFHALMAEDGSAGLLPLRLLGRARVERGDAARASEAFAHALRIAPEDHATMVDLADALMRLGETEGAKRLFTQAGTSLDADVLTVLATVLFRYNFWEQAEEVLRALVVQSPEDWTAHFKLAKLLIESWRMEEGLERLA
ncbi:MAG: tetratricopeptide repeat protein, partial [Variovorax sp.]